MIYILDGLEKKRAYSKEELKRLNLSFDTLVYSDDWAQWKKINELPDLKNYLLEEPLINTETDVSGSKQSEKTTINPFAVSIILLILSIGLSFLFTHYQRKKSYEEIKDRVDIFFQGKESVADFDIIGENDGKFQKLKSHPAFVNGLDFSLFYPPTVLGFFKTKRIFGETHKNGFDTSIFKSVGDFTKNKKINKIVDYFDIEIPESERSLAILKKELNFEYSFKNITFLDLGYFVPESEFYDYGYGIKGNTPTYRSSVSKTYSDAAKFILSEEGATHIKGGSDKIWSFDKIETDFHEIRLIYPYTNEFPLGSMLEWYSNQDKYKSSGLFSFSKENGDYTFDFYYTEEEKFKKPWFSSTRDLYITDNSNISDKETIVWYCESKNRYKVEEKNQVFYQKWATCSIICFLIFEFIYLALKNLRNRTII